MTKNRPPSTTPSLITLTPDVTGELDEAIADRNAIVQLDPDHPGFRDPEYRRRRNQIAQIAMNYHPGDPIPDAPYTNEEHQVWSVIWRALRPAHQKHACAEYLQAIQRLDFSDDRIPQLREVNERVRAISGFRLEPVAGLVQPRVFLENLADGVFLCTQYIRHHSTPLYTPEPDVVHEIVGHGVTLACPLLAELNRLLRGSQTGEILDKLGSYRAYWFKIRRIARKWIEGLRHRTLSVRWKNARRRVEVH
jgi:phenylalanine-4-hydroxylase